MSELDQATARKLVDALPRVKCDGNHGGPRCADPECWNGGSPQAAEPPIYVVLAPTGGEGYSSGHDGTPKHPGGPIVMETEIGAGCTLDKARERAAMMERRWGACRIARLVFTDDDGRPL